MAPRRQKVGTKRIDAAIDALLPCGFTKEIIVATVNKILKVYDDDAAWHVIEEGTYRLIIETILDDQEQDARRDVVPHFPTKCDVECVDAEDPLFLLYTSGSTGKPKGVLHTTGGYMVYTATTFKCTVDCGWITGHSYVTYDPLLNGATVVVFEGDEIVKTVESNASLSHIQVVDKCFEPTNFRCTNFKHGSNLILHLYGLCSTT